MDSILDRTLGDVLINLFKIAFVTIMMPTLLAVAIAFLAFAVPYDILTLFRRGKLIVVAVKFLLGLVGNYFKMWGDVLGGSDVNGSDW